MYFSLYLGNRVANLLSSTIPCGLSASVNSGTWTNQIVFVMKLIFWMETLRAQAFSTGPSCTSWSSASPMFTLWKMLQNTFSFFFWKVMGGHQFTTNTIVHVNKRSFENHRNSKYVIINTINNHLSSIIWSSSADIQEHWLQQILELLQQFHLIVEEIKVNIRTNKILTIPKANSDWESW